MPRCGGQGDPQRKTHKEAQIDAILIPALHMAHGILALREHCAEDPTGDLRKAALMALAFEVLNALRRSAIPIRVTIQPLQTGDVTGLCQMIRQCLSMQLKQVFGSFSGEELAHALESLAETIASSCRLALPGERVKPLFDQHSSKMAPLMHEYQGRRPL
jgi:hypothetical protein